MAWTITRRPTKRLPVRDPIAGILMDWFGVMSGSAKVLMALYRADAPLLKAELAQRSTIAPGGLPAYCARLRGAGLDIPSTKGRHHEGYALSDGDRAQIREAFTHTVWLLGAEGEDTFAELKDQRVRAERIASLRTTFRIQPCAAAALLALHAKPGRFVSVPSIEAALPYRNARSEDRDLKYVTMLISVLRKSLGQDAIETCYGFGYRLTETGIGKVDAALAVKEAIAA